MAQDKIQYRTIQALRGTVGMPGLQNLFVTDSDPRMTDERTASDHAANHKTGGSDQILLDELGTPTDVTTLNASTTAHGLLPKLPNDANKFLNGIGNYAVPPAGGSPPTGTGFYHITAGVADAAADDAPIDGLNYGRKDGAWEEIVTGGGSLTHPQAMTRLTVGFQ